MFEKDGVTGPLSASITDLLVEDKIIVEVKAVQGLSNARMSQLFNYLRISKCKVWFLVNFHYSRRQFRRVAMGNDEE